MTPEKIIILNYLQSHERKVSVTELIGVLDTKGFPFKPRGLRYILREMIIEDFVCIGSTDDGIFYLHNDELVAEMKAYGTATAVSYFEKINAGIKNYNAQHNKAIKQLKLFEVDKSQPKCNPQIVGMEPMSEWMREGLLNKRITGSSLNTEI